MADLAPPAPGILRGMTAPVPPVPGVFQELKRLYFATPLQAAVSLV